MLQNSLLQAACSAGLKNVQATIRLTFCPWVMLMVLTSRALTFLSFKWYIIGKGVFFDTNVRKP